MADGPAAPRKMGRPKGAKNREKPKPPTPIDPEQLIEHQLRLLSEVQSALSDDFRRARAAGEKWVSSDFITALNRHSQAVAKSVESLKKSTLIAEEMAKRMTAEQLLDAALRKIESQDIATINYAIRRLKAHRDTTAAPTAAAPLVSAGEAIAHLEDDD